VENVALLHAALGQVSTIAKLYAAVKDQARADFFTGSFASDRRKKSALKNAYSSLSHQNYEMAATLFLIAGDPKASVKVVIEKLGDPMLGFLLLRLAGGSNYATPEMVWFLKTVHWGDDLIELMIAKLRGGPDIADLLRARMLIPELAASVSKFGDRRVALFELYLYVSKSTVGLSELATNLSFDGLAPLAQYLHSVAACPYKTVRIAAGGESPDVESDDEAEKPKAKPKAGAFNFGAAWSDDSGCSDGDWSEDSDSPKASDAASTPAASLFEQFRTAVVDALSVFFGGSPSPNSLASAFAVRHGGFNIPVSLLTPEATRQVVSQISVFIDSCMSLFFDSASVPLGPREVARLVHLLLTLLDRETDLTADFSSPPADVPLHSVFGGAVTVALWSHMDGLLSSLLDDPPRLPRVDPASVPAGVSSLAVDYATPQFSESVPRLFARYLSAMATGSHALEYTRFLLMYLLFRRVRDVAARFAHAPWLDLVRTRVDSMTVSFELWQVALRFPSLDPPPFAPSDGGIARLIDGAHAASRPALDEIQSSARRRLGFPPVFACGAPPPDVRAVTVAPDAAPARGVVFMPGGRSKMLMIGGDGRLFKIVDGKMAEAIDGLAGVAAVIVHPMYPIFIALAGDGPVLHHFDDGKVGSCSVTGSRPTCGAFSPTGSKFALCGDVVNIYSFDLTKDYAPPIRRELRAPITAVAWLNSDTILAVAYGPNLIVVDTFSRYYIPIELKREWGAIVAMTIEAKSGRVVSVTKGGFLVVWDLRQNYTQAYPRSWTPGPVSAAAVSSSAEVVVFSLDRSLWLFHMSDPFSVAELPVPADVKGVSSVAVV
jgi:hypothetical protein